MNRIAAISAVTAAFAAGVATMPAAAQQQTGAVSTMTTPAIANELTKPTTQLTSGEIKGMQQKLADFGQLARYREENQQLGKPEPGVNRVVFLGDSITDAWGRTHGKFFPGKPYVNRGISGQTTEQMLLRFRQDVIDLDPAVVVILAGINDIAGNTGPETLPEIENNFRSMVALAKSAHIRVVLSSVLPASYFPWRPGVDPRQEIQALNRWLKSYTADQHLIYLDYYPEMVNRDGGLKVSLAADGAVHPNGAGYRVMGPLAEAAVEKSLATPRP